MLPICEPVAVIVSVYDSCTLYVCPSPTVIPDSILKSSGESIDSIYLLGVWVIENTPLASSNDVIDMPYSFHS